MEKSEDIELRSEKVRKIIGEIPPSIVRCGIMIISIVVLGLLTASYFIPYPETITCKVVALDDRHAQIEVPYKFVNVVKIGDEAKIEFDGFPVETYSYKTGNVTEISRTPVVRKDGNRFRTYVKLSNHGYNVERNMAGTVNILIGNKTILQHIDHLHHDN